MVDVAKSSVSGRGGDGGASSGGGGLGRVSDAGADALAATLCRMRGAALKLGQMLSIQDENLLPEPLARALKDVRTSANVMPNEQLFAQLQDALGAQWREHVGAIDETPLAAASIGQVHRTTLPCGTEFHSRSGPQAERQTAVGQLRNEPHGKHTHFMKYIYGITNSLPPIPRSGAII